MTRKLSIDVWSDVVCPWCAIGKRRLDRALAATQLEGDVAVRFHSFELDPSAPAVQQGDNAERLGKKYGKSRDEALAMMRHVEQTAAGDGLELHLTTAKTGNTFDAHRLLHLAAARGRQAELKERFLRGYMTEGAAIGDHAALAKLAVEAGLDAAEVHDVLAGDAYASDVRDDEEQARELGIHGVPFFVFGGQLAVSGAQPVEILERAIRRAWSDVARDQSGQAPPGSHDAPAG